MGPVPAGVFDLADFVLSAPSRDDHTAITELLEPMSQAVEVWLSDGIEKAMNLFNR